MENLDMLSDSCYIGEAKHLKCTLSKDSIISEPIIMSKRVEALKPEISYWKNQNAIDGKDVPPIYQHIEDEVESQHNKSAKNIDDTYDPLELVFNSDSYF